MHKALLFHCLVIVLICTTRPLSAADPDYKTDPFARDLKILTQWFAGEFDNEEQVWFENDGRSATPEKEKIPRLHTAHTRLDLPAFGQHVFYVEEYTDNKPSNVIRQRLITFTSDSDAGAIRMKQGFFKDSKAALGAHLDPRKLAGLKPEQVFFMQDLDPDSQCDVFWRRSADQYEGAIEGKGCVFGEGEKRRYSVHKMILSANKYWRLDSSYLVSDDSLYIGTPAGKPVKMRRADVFMCEASFRAGGKVQNVAPFRLHNQGGAATIVRRSDNKKFDILLRNKEYPYYDTRPDFMYFSIRHAGEKRSLAYTVNDADSRRLGIDVSGMSIHCHRQGYEFRESLSQLDTFY